MRALAVRAAKKTYPTGNPLFSVMQAFPAAVSAEEADPFLMCDHFGPTAFPGTEGGSAGRMFMQERVMCRWVL